MCSSKDYTLRIEGLKQSFYAICELAAPSCSSLITSFRFDFSWGTVGEMVCASCKLLTIIQDH